MKFKIVFCVFVDGNFDFWPQFNSNIHIVIMTELKYIQCCHDALHKYSCGNFTSSLEQILCI